MALTFKKLIEGRESSSDIDQALGEAEEALEAARRQLQQLTVERREVMLTADDAGVDEFERRLSKAERDVERLEVGYQALKDRYAEAVKKEEDDLLDAKIARAERARKHGEKLLKVYAKKAEELRDLLTYLDQCRKFLREVNKEAAEAGDPRRIRDPEFAVSTCNHPHSQYRVLERAVSLPAVELSSDNYWPPDHQSIVSTGYGSDGFLDDVLTKHGI